MYWNFNIQVVLTVFLNTKGMPQELRPFRVLEKREAGTYVVLKPYRAAMPYELLLWLVVHEIKFCRSITYKVKAKYNVTLRRHSLHPAYKAS